VNAYFGPVSSCVGRINFQKPLERVFDTVLHLELGRTIEIGQYGDCKFRSDIGMVSGMCWRSSTAFDIHVNLLHPPALRCSSLSSMTATSLRRDVLEFWLNEIVEVDQRNDVGLVGLYPLLQEPVNESQNRPCSS